MSRPSKEQQLQDLHREALADFDRIQTAVREQRLMALEDRRFYSIEGAQWEGPLGEQFENRPRFEFNRVHLAIIRIVNEYRANRIAVDFQAKDGQPDDLADVCDGLLRADEQASNAEEAYDNAFEEAAAGGIGAWRLRAEYQDDEDEDDECQRVCIEPIHDADSTVFFDLDSKRQDKRDAKRCYVLTPYTHEAFEEEFGHSPSDWGRDIEKTEFDWFTPDVVWVCEHYRVEEKTETVYWYRGLVEGVPDMKVRESELKADPEMPAELQATGFQLVKTKKVKRRAVRKLILSGKQVEEDCGYIAGKHIPIVMTYGKRWVVDGVERCMGHVRLAKDAQRLGNVLMSWLAEMSSRFDIEKPILTPEQIAGHSTMWARDNIDKFPYLLINPITDASGQQVAAGPLGYTKAPQVPPAMAALTQLAQAALEDLLGNQQAGEELKPNISGKAVELIQNRLDMQVFIYVSNFAKAMKRSGEIWLSMMRDIAPEQSRRMKTVAKDGQTGSVVLNEPTYDPKAGSAVIANDITAASFDVVSSVGPSSQSLRQAVVRALTGIASIATDPEVQQALTLATIANLEGEGLDDLREWARARAIRLGLVKPTEEEQRQLAEEQASAQPDPQTLYLQAAAAEADAKAKKANADTLDTLSAADLKQAQRAKTLAEVQATGVQAATQAAEALRGLSTPPDAQGMPVAGPATA